MLKAFQCSALFLISLLGVTGLSGRADTLAQPPVVSLIDGNNVNLATGKYVLPGLDVGIGTLERTSNENSDNFSGTIKQQFIVTNLTTGEGFLQADASYNGEVYRFIVDVGPTTTPSIGTSPYKDINGLVALQFSDPSPPCCGVSQPGTATLTLQDGTKVIYDLSIKPSGAFAALRSVTKANGEVLSLTYFSNNAISMVSSSLGWALKYEVGPSYKITKITGINTSATYCDPTAASCAVSTSYPYLSATTNGASTTIKRNGSETVTYTVNYDNITVTLPAGPTTTIVYGGSVASGKVISISKGGSTWSYSYPNATTTIVTAPNNSTRKVVYGSTGINEYTDESGRKTIYQRDNNYDRVVKIVAPDGDANTGGFTAYSYDTNRRITSMQIVPKGGATGGVANAGVALVTNYGYAACTGANFRWCNQPTSITDPNGIVTEYTYKDENGGLLSETGPAVAGIRAQKRYTYQQFIPTIKNASNATIPQPGVWRLTEISSCMTANLDGCLGGVDELKTVIGYSGGNVLPTSTTLKRGDGSLAQTTAVTYNANGSVIVTDGSKPGTDDEIYSIYDDLGRLSGAVNPDPDLTDSLKRLASRISYDSAGRPWKHETGTVATSAYSGSTPEQRQAQAAADLAGLSAKYVETTTYSPTIGLATINRRYTGAMANLIAVSQRKYDNLFRVDCEVQRYNLTNQNNVESLDACDPASPASDGTRDQVTKYNYDSIADVLLNTQSAFGTSSQVTDFIYTYDLSGATSTGLLQSVADQKGNVTRLYYDGFDREIRRCYPLPGTANNGAGNADNSGNGTTTGDCERTTYRTATLGGMVQAGTLIDSFKTRANNGNAQTISFNYFPNGRLSTKSGALTESFTYNNFGQVLTHLNTTSGQNASSAYSFNSVGQLLSDTQPAGTVTYQYDAYGRRAKLTYPGSQLYVTYAYNNADMLTKICANVSDCYSGAAVSSFIYDDFGNRLTTVRPNGVNSAIVMDYTNDRLDSITHGPATAPFQDVVTYNYSEANQISSKSNSNRDYSYVVPTTPAQAYSSNGLNQIQSVQTSSLQTFSYDARGNLTNDGGGVTYSYNANNLLTGTSGGADLRYDAEGRLRYISTPSAGVRQFVYDGTDLIGELDGSGGVLRRYIHGPGIDEPLVRYDGAGVAATDQRFLEADDQGSIILVTGNAGNQLAINTYDPFGVPAAGNQGTFQYTGQAWLPEVGLYYYKARMYSPSLGRFLQTDPIGYGDDINWYNYVHGDPINTRDPSGLLTCPTINSQGDQIVCGHKRPLNFGWVGLWQAAPTACPGNQCSSYGGVTPTPSQLVNRFLFSRLAEAEVDCPAGNASDDLSGALSGAGTAHDGLEKGIGILDEGGGKSLSHMTTGLNIASAALKFTASRQRHEPIDVSIARAGIPLVTSAFGSDMGGTAGATVGSAVEPGGGTIVGGAVGAVFVGWLGDQAGGVLSDQYATARGVRKCP